MNNRTSLVKGLLLLVLLLGIVVPNRVDAQSGIPPLVVLQAKEDPAGSGKVTLVFGVNAPSDSFGFAVNVNGAGLLPEGAIKVHPISDGKATAIEIRYQAQLGVAPMIGIAMKMGDATGYKPFSQKSLLRLGLRDIWPTAPLIVPTAISDDGMTYDVSGTTVEIGHCRVRPVSLEGNLQYGITGLLGGACP